MPGQVGGRYQLDAVVGRGGMGVVWPAVDTAGGRVAVKMIRPDRANEPDLLRRFRREAEMLASVSDHIVRVREIVTDDDDVAIVMDLVGGTDLRDWLFTRTTVDFARRTGAPMITHSSLIVGTPQYLAPEVAAGARIDDGATAQP